MPREERVVEPFGFTENKVAPVELATVSRLVVEVVVVPWMVSSTCGVVVPMPTFPDWVTLRIEVPDVEEMSKPSKVEVPVMVKRDTGTLVPMPILWVLSIRSASVPLVVSPSWFAAALNIPVSVSPWNA